MGEIHELFVLALSLVWFAGATENLGPESIQNYERDPETLFSRKGGFVPLSGGVGESQCRDS